MERTRRPSRQTLTVLALLADAPEAGLYGLEISRASGLKSGVLYPMLIRLSDQGLLAARWEPSPHPGRPARHLYRLTADGSAYLARHCDVGATWSPVPVGAW